MQVSKLLIGACASAGQQVVPSDNEFLVPGELLHIIENDRKFKVTRKAWMKIGSTFLL